MKFAPGQSVGRPKGLAEVRELARQHSPQAIEMLAHIMANGESEQARIAAANSILDRAWGKASQAHTGESGEGPVTQITRIFVEPGHQNGVRCLLLALRDRQQRLALRPVLEVLRTRIEVSPRSPLQRRIFVIAITARAQWPR